MSSILWVGGTSSLSRTYFEEVHPTHGQPTVVAAPALPSWPLPPDVGFVELDLTSEASVATLFSRLPHKVDALVLSVRCSLVWSRPEEHEQLCQHVALLLQLAAWHGVTGVLHISSIAVADHVTAQHLVREDDPVPPVASLSSPYDRFKLRCEQLVDSTCAANASRVKVWVNLRISGIFSNDPACIQCTAVRRQWLVSVRSLAAIDFNSSRNVSLAIALVLARMRGARDRAGSGSVHGLLPTSGFSGAQLFYYTRATRAPVPYWHHVRDYRRAHGIWYGVFLPSWLSDKLVPPMRHAARRVGTPLATSLDYLMAVATAEHSADNRRFRAAFPELESMEESVHECFARIRARREQLQGRSRAFGALALVAVVAVAAVASAGGEAWSMPSLLTGASLSSLSLPPPPPPPPPSAGMTASLRRWGAKLLRPWAAP